MRIIVATLAALLAASSPARAVIFRMLDDEFDDILLVRDVYDRPDVSAAREKLDEFEKGLLRLKERDFIALFGPTRDKPAKAYAMPVAQSRGLGLSGIRYGDEALNKDHTDFYVIDGVGALEVYYQIDGETPAAIMLYFPAGAGCPRLTRDNLAQRLAWDADCLERLRDHTEARLTEVFPYEVDRAALAKLESGDYATDAAAKLRAWIESGKALGYTYGHNEKSGYWCWRGPDGRLVREAYRGSGDGPPGIFISFHANGREQRNETVGGPGGELQWRRWCRADTGANIRYETRDTWCWYGKDGKPVREEWDENGDRIPDWFVTAADGIHHVGDDKARKHRRPLRLSESWAVNPDLIPEESRIPDQPDLRLPVRRKGELAGPAELKLTPLADAAGPEGGRRSLILVGIALAAGLFAAAVYLCRRGHSKV